MTYLNKILILVLTLLLVGCQQEKQDLTVYVAAIKAQQKPNIEPIPVMKPYEKFSYAAADLRNPFMATVVEQPEELEPLVDNGIHPDQHRRKEALESYTLGELQLVGTLEKEGVWALIRSSDGVIHRAQVGNHIGQNYGEVLTISEDKLTLKEIVPDGRGGYIERDSSLSVADVN